MLCQTSDLRQGASPKKEASQAPALEYASARARYNMILTQCAVCATELGLSLGKKCGRCSTRYCGAECQKQHWEEGGHDKLCKKIKKAGGAEQYNANKKYTEAVAVAVEKCADDTKGQTCYICTQALHWKTKEGLVRMCSCRGTAGFAHVSCLAEQAKILVAEAEENNLDDKVKMRGLIGGTCVVCASNNTTASCGVRSGGRAGRRTWGGRRGTGLELNAMNLLGNGLSVARHDEDALSVREAELSMERRLGAFRKQYSRHAGQSCEHVSRSGRLEEALACFKTYTLQR